VIFETERLIAKPWTLQDVPHAFRMYGDPEVMRYLGQNGAASTINSLEEMEERLAKSIAKYEQSPYIYAAMHHKPSGEVVGTGLLKPLELSIGGPAEEIEIGWHLAKDYWGQGLGTEIGLALLQHGFGTLELKELHAIAYPQNAASLRIMQKIGMEFQGSTDRYYGVTAEHYRINRA